MKTKYEEATEVFDAITEASYRGMAFKMVLMENPAALEAAKNLAAALKNSSGAAPYADDNCSSGGEHDPNWATTDLADGEVKICDITCSKCGTSGAYNIDSPEVIDW